MPCVQKYNKLISCLILILFSYLKVSHPSQVEMEGIYTHGTAKQRPATACSFSDARLGKNVSLDGSQREGQRERVPNGLSCLLMAKLRYRS